MASGLRLSHDMKVKRIRAIKDKQQGREVPRINYVAMDRVWKTCIRKERETCLSWEDKWSKVVIPWKELSKKMRLLSQEDGKKMNSVVEEEDRQFSIQPSENSLAKPLPVTSSAMIGWQFDSPANAMEKILSTTISRPR